MPSTKIEANTMVQSRQGTQSATDNLAETVYCDHSHLSIQKLSDQFTQSSTNTADLIEKVFLFVRDSIIFGGDHWQVKASETLAKGYGACYNKNLVMIALLRAAKVQSKLMANPLKKTFAKPSAGSASRFFSDPFLPLFYQRSDKRPMESPGSDAGSQDL